MTWWPSELLTASDEILARLLDLNQKRAEEERHSTPNALNAASRGSE